MDTAIYYNGTILTMEEPLYAEAVLVEDGVIRQVGSREALFAQKRADTRLVDLQARFCCPRSSTRTAISRRWPRRSAW
ncbi:MAG: hypothetical protein ACLS8R_00205 [Anaeromassilibacillus sp.]